MELRKFSLTSYKGYAEQAEVEVAPLTILVGPNNAGKTALAQALQLLAGGLTAPDDATGEPLPLQSGGFRHGDSFEDLVTGRAVHGLLRVSITLAGEAGESSLDLAVRNVVEPARPPERLLFEWRLKHNDREVVAERQGFDASAKYRVTVRGEDPQHESLDWRGLLPRDPDALAPWVRSHVDNLRHWATGVRHLRCPRRFGTSPFLAPESAPTGIGPDGGDAQLVLAADVALREAVRDWYGATFGVRIDIAAQGRYAELVTGTPVRDGDVKLAQSGRGLSHVLPVAVTALSARRAGPGADVIEHPEAELHPAAHAHVAELLLNNLAGPIRPLIAETHSEMLLLRARRWIAEGRIPAGHVLVYWIHAVPGRGSLVEKITIRDDGEMERWPHGVFIEDYEEILAIRRAARKRDRGSAHSDR
jgi:hypothetical protein